MFRPSNGSCLIWFSSNAFPSVASVVFSVTACPETSTVCDAVPTSNVIFEVVGVFTSSCRLFRSNFRNPDASAASVYAPGGSVTCAPTITAPDLSVTTPCTDVVPACPHATAATKTQIASPTPKLKIKCRFIEDHSMDCSFRAPFRRFCTHKGGVLRTGHFQVAETLSPQRQIRSL